MMENENIVQIEEEKVVEKKKSALNIFLDGLLYKNPILSLFLGIAVAVLVSSQLEVALLAGAVVLVDLLITSCVVGALRKHLDKITAALVALFISAGIAASFVMVFTKFAANASILLAAVPFVATTSIVIEKSEEHLSRSVKETLIDSLGSGLGFIIAIAIVAVICEFFGTGGINFNVFSGADKVTILSKPISYLAKPFGGLLVTGVVCGIFNCVMNIIVSRKEKQAASLKEEN